ncbi:MAG: DUF481 domain-containing protein, partial [Polyangiales bacterium]
SCAGYVWVCLASVAGLSIVTAAHAQAPAPAPANTPESAAESGENAEPAPAPEPAPPPPPPPAPPPLTFGAPTLAAPPPAGERLSEKLSTAPASDVTSLNLSAGGSVSSGNTRAFTLLAGGDFRLVRMPHSLSANAAFAYGEAADPADTESDQVMTVRNLNARAKYDFFLSLYDTLFLATGFRWDTFAGINRRNNIQAGYGRYFVSEPKHRFWAELGYDFTFSGYTALPDGSQPTEPTDRVHFGRLFLGYENQLNEFVSALGGVEGLLNFEHPGASRLNLDVALRSTLASSFKLEVKFRMAYDADPVVAGAKKTDTATVVSILYTLI